MSTHVDMRTVQATVEMAGEDEKETELLRAALVEARGYLEGFEWCRGIDEEYFGLGVGGVVAVFLFRIEPAEGADEWLWVVCGDLPSAYLVTDRASTPTRALEVYCELMKGWVDAVRGGSPLDEVFPVAIPPTEDAARALEKRVAFLREEVIPAFQ